MENSELILTRAHLNSQVVIQERLAIFLASIAGYVDATGLLKWKTYLSFMSGNTTQLGAAISSGKFEIVFTSITVISFFLFGIYCATCISLAEKLSNKTLSVLAVAGLLLTYSLLAYWYPIGIFPAIAIISFAMGAMNSIVTSVGSQKVNADFVTGTLNSLALAMAMFTMTKSDSEKKEYGANAVHLLWIWIGFLSGAAVGQVGYKYLGGLTFCFPAILLIFCAFLMPKPAKSSFTAL